MPRAKNLSRGFGITLSANSHSLKVHEIGNYNISIAPDVDSLLNRIDWNKFIRPFDFDERVATFSNTYLYPTNCVYIVAQARKNIKNIAYFVYETLNFEHLSWYGKLRLMDGSGTNTLTTLARL
jgi:hypothetical protein